MEVVQPALDGLSVSGGFGIRLLGDLQVVREGVAIDLPASKRTRALLGYLVATAAPQARERLCDLLWDGPDDPRAALRWSLSKLRGIVNDAGALRLTADRERVTFVRRETTIDLDRVRALLPASPGQALTGALEEAADLLKGEFLDGLALPACPRFHHWCMAERERFGTLRSAVLSELVVRWRDEPARALPYARALVTADPLSEAAHARLIRVLTRMGRTEDAEAHCERTADLLRREVGGVAAESLRDALREARRNRAAPRLATAAEHSHERSSIGSQLIGRAPERHRIEAFVASRSGPQRLLLILGEPGIGKTRLLQAVAALASEQGLQVGVGRCFEAEMVRPYGCFLDALRGLHDARALEMLGNAPMAIAQPDHGAAEADRRERLLAGMAAFLSDLARERACVLVLDDLQWVDEASAALLHVLARRQIQGLLLAGAARMAEIDDNVWARRLILSLGRDGLLERLPVSALNREETAALTGVDPHSDNAAIAFRDSGGNPLLALELARARAEGADPHGENLDSLVAERVARLPEPEREVVVWAAAIGRGFRPELLAACSGVAEGELIARLDRLVRRGLLHPAGEGEFDFAHDLLRRGVYRVQSQPHRRFLHRQIARALSVVAEDEPALYGDLVHHAGLAEDHAIAVGACIAAAEHCLRLLAFDQAIETLDRGLAHLSHLPPGRDRIRSQLRLLGLKAAHSGGAGKRDREKLQAELQRAIDIALLAGLYSEAVTAISASSWICWHDNDAAGAEQQALRAEKVSRTADLATRCHQLAGTGRCLLDVEMSVPRALALVQEAEEMADLHNLEFVELEWARALAARWCGRLADAARFMARALTLARASQDHLREAECVLWLAMIVLESGDFEMVEGLCEEGRRLLAQVDPPRRPVAEALQALVEMKRSRPEAAARLAASLQELRTFDDKWRLAYALNVAGNIALDEGDEARAEAAAQEALDLGRAMQRPTEITVAACLLARLAARRGDRAAATERLAEARRVQDGQELSARAEEHVRQAEAACRSLFPTLVQTAMQ